MSGRPRTCRGDGADGTNAILVRRVVAYAADMNVRGSLVARRLRVGAALLLATLVLVALVGNVDSVRASDACIVDCGGDDATAIDADANPPLPRRVPACLHDAGCGGAQSGAGGGVALAALPAEVLLAGAALSLGAARLAPDTLRPLLLGSQLYRPPRSA